ncbi:MAG: amidohydrolase family protein [Acidimicrobiales bacterium]
MVTSVVIHDAVVGGVPADLRISGDRIVAVGSDLARSDADVTMDAHGGEVIPGLHDHHIHLLALAAARRSVAVGPIDVGDADGLQQRLRRAASEAAPGEWVRAIGYHHSVAGDLDRWRLDAMVGARPVRVQHRSGALWILSSAALASLPPGDLTGLAGVERDGAGEPTGRLWRLDAWLADRVPGSPADLGPVGEALLRFGVTGVTDATPTEERSMIDEIASAAMAGQLPQRIAVTGGARLVLRLVAGIEIGPVKVLLPDHEPPDLDAISAAVRSARHQGRPVAVHCVTAETAAVAVSAIEEVGPVDGDRIEHGAVLSVGLARRIGELGITVVTNPSFVAERGDQYLSDVDPVELPDLWPCRSLLDAGVAVGGGTDAPFGDPNPWRAIAAAIDRRTATGRVLGADERIEPRRALDLFLGPLGRPGAAPRRVEVGALADLCVLPAPVDVCLAEPASVVPQATIVRGKVRRW